MAEQSRRLNGQMCWLWYGGMNPTHVCCLDLSALQRNGALVFGARSTDGDPVWGLCLAGTAVLVHLNAVVVPVLWGTRNPAGIWGKLRWWRFLAGPFTQHHCSIAVFVFLLSLGLPETWRRSCTCVNLLGGGKKPKHFCCCGLLRVWVLAPSRSWGKGCF